jgi:hypothetical protein
MAVKIGIDLGTANRMRKKLSDVYFKDIEKGAKLDNFLMFLNLSPLREKIFKNKISTNNKNLLHLIKSKLVFILKNHYFNNIFKQGVINYLLSWQ